MSEAGKIRWIPRGESARPLSVPAGDSLTVARVAWPETGRVALAGALRGDSGFAKDIALNIPLLRRSGDQIHLTSPAQIAFGHRAPDHWSGRPASFEARWDDQALTLVIEATKLDRSWSQTRIGSSQHLMDSVELFLRTTPDTVDWGSTDYQSGDIKLSFAQESQAPSRRQLNADRGGEFIDTSLVEFSFRPKTQGGPGFVCEIRIPWAAIPKTAGRRPEKWGFDVGINLSESGESRTYQYVWAGSAENWLRTDNWGLLIFD
jgi:hypothetical protein